MENPKVLIFVILGFDLFEHFIKFNRLSAIMYDLSLKFCYSFISVLFESVHYRLYNHGLRVLGNEREKQIF